MRTLKITKNKSIILPMIKNRINNMSYAEMLRHYKSPAMGSILFQGKHREYFVKVMQNKKSELASNNIKIINNRVLKKVYNSI